MQKVDRKELNIISQLTEISCGECTIETKISRAIYRIDSTFGISSFLLPSRCGRSFQVSFFLFSFFFPMHSAISSSSVRSYIQVNQKLGSDGKWLNILFRIVIARSTDALVQSSRKRLVTIKFGVLIEDRFEWEINTCLVSIFFFFSFLLASLSYFLSLAPLPHLRPSAPRSLSLAARSLYELNSYHD